MKVLVASAANSPDMAMNYLWDGLQTVLGADNVADATDGKALRGAPEGWWANDRPVRWQPLGHRVPQPGEDDFDILVATSTVFRDHDWEWLRWLIYSKLKIQVGKAVFFETLDGARDITPLPENFFDAVFRREIDPAVQYPYAHQPLPLLCAIPERWFHDSVYGWTDDKPYDVFHVSNAVTTGNPVRWSSQAPVFCTSKRYHNLVGAGVLQPNTLYLQTARKFKLIVEGPGGEGASDNGHMWESISLGAIPIFVQQSCRPRWPWFTGEHCFWCDRPNDLATVIEKAMEETDLHAMRLRLKEHALAWHTTAQRAKQFLRMVEEDAWRGAPGPWRW